MPTKVVLGLQWGDEGKGKIVDYLAEKAEVVVRFQGGQNAGHTVVVAGKKTVLHLLPSGVLHGRDCLLGNGMVIDPVGLMEELQMVSDVTGRSIIDELYISDRAHLIFPYHKLEDSGLLSKKIGTTGKGIGQAYRDKVCREGQLMQYLADLPRLKEVILERYRLAGGQDESLHAYWPQLEAAAALILPRLVDGESWINEAYQAGRQILLEGAQGTWLDIDHGTYPFVTSSNTSIGGACTGTGLPPSAINSVLGVVKAYTSRVGNGKHPTELTDDLGNYIRDRGNEFGSTTGRPRRVGWLDLVAVRKAIMINQVSELAVMKLDVLDELEEIKVATAYRHGQEEISTFPSNLKVFEESEPVYESLPGWQHSTVGLGQYADLPDRAKTYLEFIQSQTGIPIRFISTGPGREETILKEDV